MKSLLRSLIRRTVAHDGAWGFLNSTFVRLGKSLENNRIEEMKCRGLFPYLPKTILEISPDQRVAHGPFKGMVYPSFDAAGSALFPKLLGSYETELHSVIERLCGMSFRKVLDVGSAEGYYAVGLALRLVEAEVLAYDTDPRANDLCGKMARANQVEDRVHVRGYCRPSDLMALDPEVLTLIFCDCEGFELELFTPEIIPYLRKHHLLVELHDFIDITISTKMRERFADTHHIECIQSIDDVQKPLRAEYQYVEIASYDTLARKAILAEARPAIMEWFYLRPKSSP